MHETIMPFTLVVILVTTAISVKALFSERILRSYSLEVEAVLWRKQYYRVLTSGFLHVGIGHLLFNMVTLYAFGPAIEQAGGWIGFVAIYFGSLLAGSLLALLIHRNHANYTAVGASGAVSGIVFSFVLLFPRSNLMVFPIYTGIPAWVFAVLYTGITIYGIRSQSGHIGHEAHLGGAVAGMLIASALFSHLLRTRYVIVLATAGTALAFIVMYAGRTHLLGLPIRARLASLRRLSRRPKEQSVDLDREVLRGEVDALLDKVGTQGMGSLTVDERERLKSISARIGSGR